MDDKPDPPPEEPKKADADAEPNPDKSSEPDQKPSGEKREPTNVLNASIGQVQGDAIIGNGIKAFRNLVNKVNVNLGTEALRAFSLDHTYKVTDQDERDLCSYFHPDEDTIDSLRAVLEERHMVVLTGEAGQGKTETAIYMSHLLRSGQDRAITESRKVHPLERNVKLVFRDVIANKKSFGRKMLIFRDVFSTKNPGVLEFFALIDRHRLDDVAERLRKSGVFLFFTTDTAAIDKKCHDNLSSLNVIQQLPMMTEGQLKHGLELKLKALCERNPTDETNPILSDSSQTLLIQRLRMMPRISQFLDNYLLHLKRGLDLNEALARFENLEGWFQRELADEGFDVWCFAFSLGLCQCIQDQKGVPWFEFEVFRRAFSRRLAGEFNLPHQRRSAFRESISEDSLVERCRAQIFENQGTGAHCVRFSDDRYPEMLWKSFLKSNRKLIFSVVGQLKKMAADYDPFIRRRAAQILGRIGEIDPIQLTLSLMSSWKSSGDYRENATVGYLYEGILASQNERYKSDFLRELSGLVTEVDKPEILTAIAAYQRVGLQNLSLAMQRFRDIAERKLVEALEDTKRIDKILTRVEDALDQATPQTAEQVVLDFYKEGLSDAANRIYDKNGPFLSAIQHSVVTLCLEGDLFRVLHELSKWLESDQKALSYVVTLIFLMEGGIADALDSRRAEFAIGDTNDSEPRECSRLLFSIASDENSVQSMAEFICGVFAGFSNFLTPRYRRFLRDVLFWRLKKWAEDSLSINRCRNAMEQLFTYLLTGRDADLKRRLLNFIRADHDFTNKDKPLYEFARAVFARETAAAAQRRSLILA